MSGKVSLINQFDRVLAQPLETNSVFTSYDNALEYAKNNKTSYAGQILRVVKTDNTEVYVINRDKSITLVGSYYGVYEVTSSPMTIVHNLRRCPSVIFVGEDGEIYEVNVTYPNVMTTVITWNNKDIKGKIYLL